MPWSSMSHRCWHGWVARTRSHVGGGICSGSAQARKRIESAQYGCSTCEIPGGDTRNGAGSSRLYDTSDNMVLKEVSGNVQSRQLSPYERAQIVTLQDTGQSDLEIQKFIEKKIFAAMLFEHHSPHHPTRAWAYSRSHPSRQPERKTTQEQDHKLVELAMSDPDQKVFKIATKVNFNKHTVQQRLKEHGL